MMRAPSSHSKTPPPPRSFLNFRTNKICLRFVFFIRAPHSAATASSPIIRYCKLQEGQDDVISKALLSRLPPALHQLHQEMLPQRESTDFVCTRVKVAAYSKRTNSFPFSVMRWIAAATTSSSISGPFAGIFWCC